MQQDLILAQLVNSGKTCIHLFPVGIPACMKCNNLFRTDIVTASEWIYEGCSKSLRPEHEGVRDTRYKGHSMYGNTTSQYKNIYPKSVQIHLRFLHAILEVAYLQTPKILKLQKWHARIANGSENFFLGGRSYIDL